MNTENNEPAMDSAEDYWTKPDKACLLGFTAASVFYTVIILFIYFT